ncbi:AlbA family DNA-binding domain-containing protein [Marixanthomonas spongiae]|uniref:ATP-binding protein n=1 Tax=Marixanthomonas spongiae TaxID=2174845 RepID=A0A2U0I2H5_9FLAO|nr:ATP-binding protein [Marixanthomonas spongiae]PVW15306.1 ATP-binding protein [Marixanthomonas spongiae]
MITDKEFKDILNKNESTILDFKEDIYDFNNDRNGNQTSKFLKDVISFSNTIRTEKSFIIFGVRESDNKTTKLKGISKAFDDAILQQKVKDKVIPRPVFSYYTKEYDNKMFGILEFPITKYEMPIMPSVSNLKGLEQGRVYYRNGSSNTEAKAIDTIRINEWLKSLPNNGAKNSLNSEISKYLTKLTDDKIKLSALLTKLLLLAKENELVELQNFCESEISGTDFKDVKADNHRVLSCYWSWQKIEINPFSMIKPTVQLLKNELDGNLDFKKGKIAITHPIITIEKMIKNMGDDLNSSYGILETNTKALLGMEKEHTIFLYFFPDDFERLYRAIKQKLIDILMQI